MEAINELLACRSESNLKKSRFSVAPPVKSEAFKRWFGDSKAVNTDGSPKVFSHFTGDLIDFALSDFLSQKNGLYYGMR